MAAQLKRLAVLLWWALPMAAITVQYGVPAERGVTASTTAGSGNVVVSPQPVGEQQFEAGQVISIAGVPGFKIIDSVAQSGEPATADTTLVLLNDDRTAFSAPSTASGLAIRFIADGLDHTSVRIWTKTDSGACINMWYDVAPHQSGPQYSYRSSQTAYGCSATTQAVDVIGMQPSTKYYFRANAKSNYGPDNTTACNADACGATEFTLTTPPDTHDSDGRPPMPALPEAVASQVSDPLDTTGYEVIAVPGFDNGVARGSISNGGRTLTLDTVPPGMSPGQWIYIEGAKCPAHNFLVAPWCKIQSLAGNIVTLEQPADATVTDAPVNWAVYSIHDMIKNGGKRYGTVFEFKQGYLAKWWPTSNMINWQEGLDLIGLPADSNANCSSSPCSIDDPAHRWIVLRTANGPGKLPPVGVRTGPEFDGVLGGFEIQLDAAKVLNFVQANGMPPHHYRVENLEFTSPAAGPNDADPRGYDGAASFQDGPGTRQAKYVVFDRIHAHTPDDNTRYAGVFFWAGSQMALVNSYMRGAAWIPYLFHYGPDAATNGDTTMSGNQISIAGMQFQRNKFQPVSAQGRATVTADGTANGTVTIYGYLDTVDRTGIKIVYTASKGITLSCAGCGSVTAQATPTIPSTGKKFFTATVADGGNTIACAERCEGNRVAYMFASTFSNDNVGGSCVYAANGDHWLFENNHMECYSVAPIFIDIPAVYAQYALIKHPPRDITIRRNYFYYNQTHRLNSPVADGFWYQIRHNGIEFKRGSHVLIEGNEFEGGWARVNHGTALVLSNTSSENEQPVITGMTDFTIRYNLFHTQAEPFGGGGHQADRLHARDSARLYFGHNLTYGQNAFVQNQLPAPGYYGRQVYVGGHDVIVDHNTWFDSRSNMPIFQPVGDRGEGVWFQNNMWHLNRDGLGPMFFTRYDDQLLMQPAPTVTDGGAGQPTFDLALGTLLIRAAESVIPSYRFSHNVITCGLQQSLGAPGTDYTQAQCDDFRSRFGSLAALNYFPTGPTKQAREEQVGWVNPQTIDFRLSPNSPYASGSHKSTDDLDIGADFTTLMANVGWTSDFRVRDIGTNAATVQARAPTSGASCSVAYGTDPNPSKWVVAQSTTAQASQRSFSLSGLSAGKTYNYQVWCAGTRRSATHQFTTANR